MANTTSGTYTFDKDFSIDEVILEAFERLGLQPMSGNNMRTARRSLNILFSEWGNRGLKFWEVANNSIMNFSTRTSGIYYVSFSISDGTSSATAVYGVDDVLEAVYRNSCFC
jgi:hypothetical protein